ncbi:MAG TPA: ABC transporter ATP-binding protein [Gemmatimonadaceae bacterium]|nr:ABC transporter ATP-binding protein [Gemmatimonadaceae bacterium]
MTASTDFAIETHALHKVFGPQVAVRSLTLAVPRGEIFGFLGPNGAGKSTSIKMLLGLVRPTAGTALVLGAPVGDVEVRRHIGFLPEDFRFYEWLTATELVRLHGRLCGMTAAQLRTRVPDVLDLVGLTPHRHRTLRGFSKGMLQRIGLAQALVHEPQLIFLDEPTSGLDPMGRRMVRDILRAERDRGATVFLNSHLLSEIEVTCDRVAFIRDGEVVATRDLGTGWQDETRVVVHARHVSNDAMAGLAQWTSAPQLDGDQLQFSVSAESVLPDVVRHLVQTGADVFRVTPERPSLEEVFVTLMGEDRGL